MPASMLLLRNDVLNGTRPITVRLLRSIQQHSLVAQNTAPLYTTSVVAMCTKPGSVIVLGHITQGGNAC